MKSKFLVFITMLNVLLSAQTINFEVNNNNIKIILSEFQSFDELFLYRSTTNLKDINCPNIGYHVSQYKLIPALEISFQDTLQADNVTYYYKAVLHTEAGVFQSQVDSIFVPDKNLPELTEPFFLVDKSNYILELWDDNVKVKTYPIALGQNPVKRKMYFDNSCTPEGIYKISNLQPRAKYYKAFDINYPNAVDWARFSYYRQQQLSPFDHSNPAIGGEIQIHGCGISNNWTFGCMALRNEDIDELFSAENIRSGMKAIIIGEQFDRDDIPFLLRSRNVNHCKLMQAALQQQGYYSSIIDGIYGPATGKAVAEFQADNNLMITCDFDKETAEKLLGNER